MYFKNDFNWDIQDFLQQLKIYFHIKFDYKGEVVVCLLYVLGKCHTKNINGNKFIIINLKINKTLFLISQDLFLTSLSHTVLAIL